MTPPDANEKLTRRILGGLGVRPVGHQAPNTGDPVQATAAPAVPAQRANRIPPWWETKKPIAAVPAQASTTAATDPAAPVPPQPASPPRDWLDDILDSDPAPTEPAEPEDDEPEEAEPGEEPAPAKTQAPKPDRKKKAKKPEKPRPGAPRSAWDTRPASPRQSLLDAWDAVPYRLKWLAYHATAAYMGWETGLVDYATYVTAWIADTGTVGVQAFFWYGAATSTFLLYRRTRTWGPVAWCAAIPLCSTVTGVLLYAPTK
jgi:hypothetical protein